MPFMMRAKILGLLCVAALGCSARHGGPDDSAATLSIDPPTSELMIVNGAAASESFTATLTYPDGTTKDVTADTAFSVNPTYGGFSGPTLTMQTAGKTQVSGTWTGKVGTAQVIARLKDIRVDPAVPPNAPDWFSGPEDPTRAPTVVYPAVGVVMPRNLGDFEVHWTDSHGNDVYEVSLQSEFSDVRAYVPGGNVSATATWMAFLASEWLDAVGADVTVTFQVRGVQSSNPISVGSAAPQLVKLSNEAMNGGLYYWAATAANGPYGIFRHDMSKPGQPAMQFMTTAQTGGRCVACHVLSRDGKEMAITYDGGNGAATMVDVGTAAAKASITNWNFGTFTPDGTRFLSVYNGTLTVRDYATQAAVATMTASGAVSHPDLSPDGTKLVYVHPGVAGSDWSFGTGQIFVRSYDQATNTFGPEQQLVANGANNYYPSFSPDGQWILFNKGDNTVNQAMNAAESYNGPNASLWVVKADGTTPPVELATANQGLGLTNSWGRWAPFAQTIGSSNEQMFWVTVSSKRDFGVRLVGVNKPQIWMTPFYPDRAAQGQDPSSVAFRLPFQNIDSNNHIAQWTEQIVVTQ